MAGKRPRQTDGGLVRVCVESGVCVSQHPAVFERDEISRFCRHKNKP
jgi:hypothetical protein